LARNPDTKLDQTLTDKGVSGFRGKNASQGALADFLRAIEDGSIKAGSTLIIESIDRLGRQSVDDMYQLVRKILKKGIRIVTLMPERTLAKENLNDLVSIMEILVYASRAREESEMKSHRATSAWEHRRKLAVSGSAVGGHCPSWLEYQGGKFVAVKEKVLVVKKMFDLVLEGLGVTAICRRFNQEGVKVIGKRKNCTVWRASSILKTLHNRAVLGEYLPSTRTGATGEVATDYYPRVISDATFHKVGAVLSSRKKNHTYISTGINNLFSGLVWTDDAQWIFAQKGCKTKRDDRRLVCQSDRIGTTKLGTIQYPLFENLVLSFLQNWGVELQKTNHAADKLNAKKAELETLAKRLQTLSERLQEDEDLDTLLSAIRALEGKRRGLMADIEALEEEAAIQHQTDLHETQDLIRTSKDRGQIRQAIANTVERIEVTKSGKDFHAKIVLRGYSASGTVSSKNYKDNEASAKKYRAARAAKR
jgi:DNA invertase Pin-like site-specific DNA recombinase